MFRRKKEKTVSPRLLKRLFEKRILKRGFKRKQAKQLVDWFKEYAEINPALFKNDIEPRDKEALEAKITEINESFFDWAESNKTLDPRIWGDQ